MKKKIIILSILLLFISGCSSGIFVADESTNFPDGTPVETITKAHYEIHEGMHFFNRNYATLSNGEVQGLLVRVGNLSAHMIFEVENQVEAMYMLYENATINNNGTDLLEVNRNRISSNIATTNLYIGVNSSNNGNLLARSNYGINKAIGGGSRDSEEIILRPNTNYILYIENKATGDNNINWVLDWYEE